jgi:hypothetical protein
MAIEGLIDLIGIPNLLEMMAWIAGTKSEMLRHSWQDDASGKQWVDVGTILINAMGKVERKLDR